MCYICGLLGDISLLPDSDPKPQTCRNRRCQVIESAFVLRLAARRLHIPASTVVQFELYRRVRLTRTSVT
ncbi:unnamed protein product [Danaus chrysippus]|uniref:(African queen) hypothetical protein n=1 Tax=Danaus chrysippus TaxID=151541 RepID=A0A8J2QC63_9NEOP|nr:unnamed protein product [Danaus chrysippus]